MVGPPQVRGGVLQHFDSFMSRMYSQTWMSATFTSVAQPTVSKRTALALRLLNRFKSMISAKNESGLLIQNPHFIGKGLERKSAVFCAAFQVGLCITMPLLQQ